MFRYDYQLPGKKKGNKRAWFYKEDFVGHRPCLLKDGRIRTSTHDFKDEQELRDFLDRLIPLHMYGVTVEMDNGRHEYVHTADAVPLTHAVQRWLGAMAHLDERCPDGGVSSISPDIGCESPAKPDSWETTHKEEDPKGSSNYIHALAPDEEDKDCFYRLDYNFETCTPALQDGDIDRSLLRTSRPELSTFLSSYPLTADQANIISTILDNVDHINIDRLFKALLPSFVEAVECGVARKIANEEIEVDYQDVEDWMLDIIEDVETNGIGRLPTLREILSKTTSVQRWK